LSPILNYYKIGIQLFLGLDLLRVSTGNPSFHLSRHLSSTPVEDLEALEERAIQWNLLIVPGPLFSKRNVLIRVSFAASEETLPVI
jgi:hypothetical protein